MSPLVPVLAALLVLPAAAAPKKKLVEKVDGPLFGCGEEQKAAALAAAKEARRRVALAKTVLGGDTVFGDEKTRAKRREWARGYADKIFGMDAPGDGDIRLTLSSMETALSGAWSDEERSFKPDLRCSDASDSWCKTGAHAAHAAQGSRTIRLCPHFFDPDTGRGVDQGAPAAEARVRVLVHESAHSAGVGARPENYCPVFDCSTGCADEDGKKGGEVADAWAHFVHCASNQPRDRGFEAGR